MTQKLILIFAVLLPLFTHAQIQPVDVADLTIKVGIGEVQNLFYSFAEGDEIIFNFEEIDGKPLKTVEIVESEKNSKFMDFKTSSIKDHRIRVPKTAVYWFKFENTALAKRVCRIKIQRVPKSKELVNFDTNWKWQEIYDTTFVPYEEDSLVGYDTTNVPYTKREVIRIDTAYQEIHSPETEIWMYSRTNVKACFGKSESCTKNVITLNYPDETNYLLVWVGVGQETREAYNKLSKGVLKIAARAGLSYLSGGSSLLANSFTNKMISAQIDNIPTSENVLDVHFTDYEWANHWYNDYQNQIQTYDGLSFKDRANMKAILGRNQIPKGKMYLCLKNNNISVGTSVSVSVVAVIIDEVYGDVEYTRQEVKPRYVQLNKTRVEVSTSKIRVTVQ